MAALSNVALPYVVDLRQVRAASLDALLAEETASWHKQLHWDFSPSAELVRRFVEMQALAGFALLSQNSVIGYVYYVCEERKGLIGDLYVMEEFRTVENENLLLNPVLDALFTTPFVRRVESQLMMVGQPFARALPRANRVQVYERDFMEIDLPSPLLGSDGGFNVHVEQWQESDQEEAARVIASAYDRHVDSRINDQYRSPAGARRFLLNIVQYPGCGAFLKLASFVALHPTNGTLCGICLSSMVNNRIGHITQICVTPEVRGTGVGYVLLRKALTALTAQGCERASLTVTAANESAIRLYERVGFRKTRSFAAYVWE